MKAYEYRVVELDLAAPGRRADPTPQDFEALLNRLGAEGWEFLRIETLTRHRRRWFRRPAVEYADYAVLRRSRSLAQQAPARTGATPLVLTAADTVAEAERPPVAPAAPRQTIADAPAPAADHPPRIEEAVRGMGGFTRHPETEVAPSKIRGKPPVLRALRSGSQGG